MSDPKTMPQTFTLRPRRGPAEAHAAWITRSERLVNEFHRQLPAATAGEPPSIGFVLMLCDFLWDERGEEADFGELDLPRLVEHCRGVLRSEAMAQAFASTLTGYYEFLLAQHEIGADAARHVMAQLQALPEILAELGTDSLG